MAILVLSFATSALCGCHDLPRNGWPVVRAASPAQDIEDIEVEENDSPAVDDSEPSPNMMSRQPGGRFEFLDPPARGGGLAPFARAERSPFTFDEGPESAAASGGPDATTMFEGEPPVVEGSEDNLTYENECEPYRLWPDVKSVPCVLWADAKSLFTWPNAFILGAAAGGAVVLRDDVDLQVRRETAEHPSRWGEGSEVLRQFGEFSYQVPALVGVYAASLWTQDETLHEFSLSTLSAYGLTAAATVTIKGITNTHRPTEEFQDGNYGFPSYHSASTFCIAACIEEFYGWKFGLPAYALAGLVGWSRIDQREHDLSDVLFGAVLGVVIGKTVSAAHLDRQADLSIAPYYDARNRATGISVEKRY